MFDVLFDQVRVKNLLYIRAAEKKIFFLLVRLLKGGGGKPLRRKKIEALKKTKIRLTTKLPNHKSLIERYC